MKNNMLLIKKIIKNYLNFKKINSEEQKKISKQLIIESPKNKEFGHLSTNLLFLLIKILKLKLNIIGEDFRSYILKNYKNFFDNITIIKGFTNFYFSFKQLIQVIENINNFKDLYGESKKNNEIYNIELVSANPTGFLHLGHARNACIADSLVRILQFNGSKVIKEYYVNNAGNQINILALTVFLYYLKICKVKISDIPEDCYKGEIYNELAKNIYNNYGNEFINVKYSNKELIILDKKTNDYFKEYSWKYFLKQIKKQLLLLDISIDHFIYESDFYKNGLILEILNMYKKNNYTFEKEGAIFLKTEDYGDDKNRVLIKSDGSYTYLVPDIAGHYERILRNPNSKLIDFFGGDHHGYIDRLKISLKLLGFKDVLDIEIIQMVKVIFNNQEQKMSKRKGTAIWLRDLINQFGKSLVRYILTSKSQSSHINFDIEQLSKNNENNPVFYIQYATARCFNILKKAKKLNLKPVESFEYINNIDALNILNELDLFNSFIEKAALNKAPNIICDYIYNLSKKFHSYYNKYKIIDLKNLKKTAQSVELIKSINQVLLNSFKLIGIDYKEKMY